MEELFYTLTLRDFREIPNRHLQVGDRFAWGTGSRKIDRYGAIRVDEVVFPDDGSTFAIRYTPPPGAKIESTANRTISIFWHGDQAEIYVWENLPKRGKLLIQKEP